MKRITLGFLFLCLLLMLGTTNPVVASPNGTWETVGSAGFSAGTAYTTSLAIDSGTPYVAFNDGSNSSKATVMKYNGVSWETVGPAGFSAGAAGWEYNAKLSGLA